MTGAGFSGPENAEPGRVDVARAAPRTHCPRASPGLPRCTTWSRGIREDVEAQVDVERIRLLGDDLARHLMPIPKPNQLGSRLDTPDSPDTSPRAVTATGTNQRMGRDPFVLRRGQIVTTFMVVPNRSYCMNLRQGFNPSLPPTFRHPAARKTPFILFCVILRRITKAVRFPCVRPSLRLALEEPRRFIFTQSAYVLSRSRSSSQRRWGECFVCHQPFRMVVFLLVLAVLGPTWSRAEEQAAPAQQPAPAAEAEQPQPAAKPVVPALSGPPPIAEVTLVPMLPTTPVRRGATGYNVQMVDASLLPRDKEGIWVLDFSFKPVRLRTIDLTSHGQGPQGHPLSLLPRDQPHRQAADVRSSVQPGDRHRPAARGRGDPPGHPDHPGP